METSPWWRSLALWQVVPSRETLLHNEDHYSLSPSALLSTREWTRWSQICAPAPPFSPPPDPSPPLINSPASEMSCCSSSTSTSEGRTCKPCCMWRWTTLGLPKSEAKASRSPPGGWLQYRSWSPTSSILADGTKKSNKTFFKMISVILEALITHKCLFSP